MRNVKIRALKTLSDFDLCVHIQKKIWRHKDIDLTPVHQFCVSVQTGGILLGAFVEKEAAGFVYSFPAIFGRTFCQHSHLLAVMPEYQGYGIGKRLKWAQRAEALKRGFNLITWTFDPLQARNANLNIHSLGAVTQTYLSNFYGRMPALTFRQNMPTDRFFMEWWIKERRVELRRKEKNKTFKPENMAKALERRVGPKSDVSSLEPPRLFLKEGTLLVEAPRDIKELRLMPPLVARWQSSIRRTMTHYFSRGYRVEDFFFGERCFYVLHKKERGNENRENRTYASPKP
ncbi:MAG: GNAT family N-acetyltransferase [Candidatus Aminicenantales bacterium]